MSDTDAATITALLKELKEVDLETWEAIYETGFNRCHWPDDLIQGCIQRAIAARGWPHEQTHYMGNADFWEVKIYSCEKFGVLAKAIVAIPHVAILAAYIAAVRASK